jgi:hypothetical protein
MATNSATSASASRAIADLRDAAATVACIASV